MSRDIDDMRHPEWSPCPFDDGDYIPGVSIVRYLCSVEPGTAMLRTASNSNRTGSPCPFCGQLHGTACNGVDQERPVVHHAQQCDWRSVLRNPYIPDWQTTMTFSREWGERLADYIERLERENAMMREEFPCDGILDCVRCEHRVSPDECEVIEINAKHKAERDALRKEHEALLAEHEAGSVCGTCGSARSEAERSNATYICDDPWHAAHDNAERVMQGE